MGQTPREHDWNLDSPEPGIVRARRAVDPERRSILVPARPFGYVLVRVGGTLAERTGRRGSWHPSKRSAVRALRDWTSRP